MTVVLITLILAGALLFECLHPAGFLYPHLFPQEETTTHKKKKPIIPPPTPPSYPDPTLVLYLPFNEGNGDTTYDNSSYGNNGTIYGATWVDGKLGKALSFDGDDYILIPDSDSLDLTEAFTILAWVNRSSAEEGEWHTVISKGVFITIGDYALQWGDLILGVAVHTTEGQYDTSGEASPDLGQWMFISATFKDSTLKIYKNLNLVDEGTVNGVMEANSDDIFIGAQHGWGITWSGFKGVIDEVRIYNRALNLTEIEEIYLEV